MSLTDALLLLLPIAVLMSAGMCIALLARRKPGPRLPMCLWCSHPEHIDTCMVADDIDGVTCGCDPAVSLSNNLLRSQALRRSREPVEGAARAVWHAWYVAMCAQRREVAPERRSWELLPERERSLDRHIARMLAAHWGVELEEAD